jgi:4-hydroxythreonine-4-phosphate dehydrogenase
MSAIDLSFPRSVSTELPLIAVTAGEPAGIGPELCARLARRHREQPWPARLVVLGDARLLRERSARMDMAERWPAYDPSAGQAPGEATVWDHALAAPVTPGRVDPANAGAVVATLESAARGAMAGTYAAIVTAPVHKGVINEAGIAFTGHTEFFAQCSGTPQVVMLLAGGAIGASRHPLRVALATTHLSLARVPAAITRDSLRTTLRILHRDLQAKFGFASPRIAVCGLNPHAGEGGHLGREEIDTIAPVIAALHDEGMDLEGPFPADTIFVPSQLQRFDCVLAMYHDQGLPVLKHASFGHGVNVTLGLPFVRTSVDHGTALDLAADPTRARGADPGSLYAAVDLALELARRAAS